MNVPLMNVKQASHLPAFVGGRERSHGVICEELASYRRHPEQITNSYPNQHKGGSTAAVCALPLRQAGTQYI